MVDKNNNGIPDDHELWFLVVRVGILIWSMGMLTASYFTDKHIDQTFFATTTTAAAASFGMKPAKKDEKKGARPTGRTSTPTDFLNK